MQSVVGFSAPVVLSSPQGNQVQVSRTLNFRQANFHLARHRQCFLKMLSRGPQEEDNPDVNWDDEWKTFQESGLTTGAPGAKDEAGGVFKFGEKDSSIADTIEIKVDARTEQLTDAWSNSNGFLVGIGIILLIAVAEGYVWFQSQAT